MRSSAARAAATRCTTSASLNGTYVNRERIDAAPLSGGDEVQIGKFRLVFLTAASEPASGPGSERSTVVPPARTTRLHAGASRRPLTIGEVLAPAAGRVPGRHHQQDPVPGGPRGWSSPERTPSGYRKFSADDVARLRYVLAQQRDHYLPLRVIKDQLDAIDRGLVPPAHGPAARACRTSLAPIDGQRADRRALPPGTGRAAAVAGGTAQRRRPAQRAAAASSSSSG